MGEFKRFFKTFLKYEFDEIYNIKSGLFIVE